MMMMMMMINFSQQCFGSYRVTSSSSNKKYWA